MMEKTYLVILTLIGAIIALYGIITLQILPAAVFLVVVILVALCLQLRSTPQHPVLRDDGLSAILAAAAIAGVFTFMHLEFLLWAVALAALFLIEQSLARIEKRLDKQ